MAGGRPWSMPLAAALLTAIHPYFIVMSVLLLSEAVFVPLMLASLWGMAVDLESRRLRSDEQGRDGSS